MIVASTSSLELQAQPSKERNRRVFTENSPPPVSLRIVIPCLTISLSNVSLTISSNCEGSCELRTSQWGGRQRQSVSSLSPHLSQSYIPPQNQRNITPQRIQNPSQLNRNITSPYHHRLLRQLLQIKETVTRYRVLTDSVSGGKIRVPPRSQKNVLGRDCILGPVGSRHLDLPGSGGTAGEGGDAFELVDGGVAEVRVVDSVEAFDVGVATLFKEWECVCVCVFCFYFSLICSKKSGVKMSLFVVCVVVVVLSSLFSPPSKTSN